MEGYRSERSGSSVGDEGMAPWPLVDLATVELHTLPHTPSLRLERLPRTGGPALVVHLDGSAAFTQLTIPAPGGAWDLSPYRYVSFDVANRSVEEILITARLEGEQWVSAGDVIPAGGNGTVMIIVPRNGAIPEHIREAIHNMNGLPGYLQTTLSRAYDVRRVTKLCIYALNASSPHTLEISNVRAEGRAEFPSKEWLAGGFFPFVDGYGQYRHDEWPTKIHSVEELRATVAVEDADLAAHPGPKDWNKYGGWATGPQLEATGHFRTEKYRDRWWLVDPEGRLFWSHGVTCVRASEVTTPITRREHYFADLPPRDRYPQFYQERWRAPFGFYKNEVPTVFDFGSYNSMRKYGPEWERIFIERSHRRLRSWGLNTLGAWTAESVYLKGRTPYAVYISSGGRSIEGGEGLWRKFPDPFDTAWRQALVEWLANEKDKSLSDPYCIGYFVDNELSWGDDTYLGRGVLLSPPDQPAKLALRDRLRAKYGTIDALNRTWGVSLADWEAFLTLREIPQGAEDDLREFTAALAEQYFRGCRDEIKRADPTKLYLGCRWDLHLYPHEDITHRWVVRIGARYCDILSFNRYRYSCLELVPPEGVDMPIMITEWHVGTMERGMFHSGLRGANSAEHARRMYEHYVREALRNPYVVGTHWFQYADEAMAGRADGENYRCGFVDITDQPYEAVVAASRAVGYGMYALRLLTDGGRK